MNQVMLMVNKIFDDLKGWLKLKLSDQSVGKDDRYTLLPKIPAVGECFEVFKNILSAKQLRAQVCRRAVHQIPVIYLP